MRASETPGCCPISKLACAFQRQYICNGFQIILCRGAELENERHELRRIDNCDEDSGERRPSSPAPNHQIGVITGTRVDILLPKLLMSELKKEKSAFS